MTSHLGLDLGGTNIKHALLRRDSDRWTVVDRGQLATRSVDGPQAVIDRLVATASRLGGPGSGVAGVGIGIPGIFDPTSGRTRFLTNFPGDWSDRAVVGPISAVTGTPTTLINDARAFGLAELRLGAGRGADTMIGLTLGTGIGGVVVVSGRLHEGPQGNAGEIGHQTIEPDGPLCQCGNRGCLEAFARADRIAAACGTDTAESAIRAAQAGDAQALAGIRRIGGYLGIGIANVVTVLSPDRIVIGGGIAAAGDLLLAPIQEELRRRVRYTRLDGVTLAIAELGTWAGAIGAALRSAEATGSEVHPEPWTSPAA